MKAINKIYIELAKYKAAIEESNSTPRLPDEIVLNSNGNRVDPAKYSLIDKLYNDYDIPHYQNPVFTSWINTYDAISLWSYKGELYIYGMERSN